MLNEYFEFRFLFKQKNIYIIKIEAKALIASNEPLTLG